MMLGHTFPRVREYIAQQVYVLLLEHPELLADDESVLDMILTTPWASADTPTAQMISHQVAKGLGVDLALSFLASSQQKKVETSKPPTDDFATYASLVQTL
jgi:hypothetical protein